MDSSHKRKQAADGCPKPGLRDLKERVSRNKKISVIRPDRSATGTSVAECLEASPALSAWLPNVLGMYRAAGTNKLHCVSCRKLVAASASITVHRCKHARVLPSLVEAEVVKPSGPNTRCTLCNQNVKAGHACPLGRLSTLAVDTLGLTFMPPPAYQRASERAKELHEEMARMARSNCLLCLTLVQLPGETSFSQTLTYLGTSAIPDCTSFERLADGRFKHSPQADGGKMLSMPAVRYLPSSSRAPRSQPAGAPADSRGLATDADGASKAPRFLYAGPMVSGSRDKTAGGGGSDTISRMASIVDTRHGRRLVKRVTVVDPQLYGSMAFKLNHHCDAKLVSRSVPLPAWGHGVSLPVLEVPHDRPASFQPHEELLWPYDGCCDDPAEEALCCCGSARCRTLLVRWEQRGEGELATVLDARGQPVDTARWADWLRAQHGPGGSSL